MKLASADICIFDLNYEFEILELMRGGLNPFSIHDHQWSCAIRDQAKHLGLAALKWYAYVYLQTHIVHRATTYDSNVLSIAVLAKNLGTRGKGSLADFAEYIYARGEHYGKHLHCW